MTMTGTRRPLAAPPRPSTHKAGGAAARISTLALLLLILEPTVGFRLPLRAPPPPIADNCAPEPLGAAATMNKGLITGLKGVIDAAYAGRDIQRFYVLETVARVPYFSYLACLHLYET